MLGAESIDAAMIVSDFDARYTFTELVPPPELEPEFNRAVRNVRYSGAVARINFALKELPKFAGISEDAPSGHFWLLHRVFPIWKRHLMVVSAERYPNIHLWS